MKTKDVWFNKGRWIVRCPICGGKNKIRPPKGRKQIKWYCGACYPGKIKKKFERLPNGEIIPVVDKEAQRLAADMAWQNEEIHTAVMPEGWEEAARLLRLRRIHHQGWYPGDFASPNDKKETLAELEEEQRKHPLLGYLRKERQAPIVKDVPVEKKKEREPMSDKMFRSLQ